MFFWPEGWYEWNEQEETHWKIPEEVPWNKHLQTPI